VINIKNLNQYLGWWCRKIRQVYVLCHKIENFHQQIAASKMGYIFFLSLSAPTHLSSSLMTQNIFFFLFGEEEEEVTAITIMAGTRKMYLNV